MSKMFFNCAKFRNNCIFSSFTHTLFISLSSSKIVYILRSSAKIGYAHKSLFDGWMILLSYGSRAVSLLLHTISADKFRENVLSIICIHRG